MCWKRRRGDLPEHIQNISRRRIASGSNMVICAAGRIDSGCPRPHDPWDRFGDDDDENHESGTGASPASPWHVCLARPTHEEQRCQPRAAGRRSNKRRRRYGLRLSVKAVRGARAAGLPMILRASTAMASASSRPSLAWADRVRAWPGFRRGVLQCATGGRSAPRGSPGHSLNLSTNAGDGLDDKLAIAILALKIIGSPVDDNRLTRSPESTSGKEQAHQRRRGGFEGLES